MPTKMVETKSSNSIEQLDPNHHYSENARAAYEDSLTLWKDADPDVPVLRQAKAEYETLQ
jgi:hypothetical protein